MTEKMMKKMLYTFPFHPLLLSLFLVVEVVFLVFLSHVLCQWWRKTHCPAVGQEHPPLPHVLLPSALQKGSWIPLSKAHQHTGGGETTTLHPLQDGEKEHVKRIRWERW